MTDEADVAATFAELADRRGALDVLVNNAGIIRIDDLQNTSVQDFERILAVNTTAAFLA